MATQGKVKYEPWTRTHAIAFLIALEDVAAQVGFHVAMAGSVLTKGRSEHDLDVVVFPHDSSESIAKSRFLLENALVDFGMVKRLSSPELKKFWREKGSWDDKEVEVWWYGGHRVDLLFLR